MSGGKRAALRYRARPGRCRMGDAGSVAGARRGERSRRLRALISTRLPERPGQLRHASDNREELARAREALALAAAGRRVAVVSGGDPGVFAMAAAVFEAIEAGDAGWRGLEVRVIPGITAMQAAAARIGAPLGHDFCAISLSDNLKPWSVIEKRLDAAAEADFVIALYNPASKARPRRIHEAFDRLRARKSPATPVIFARALGRAEERLTVTTPRRSRPGPCRYVDPRHHRLERDAPDPALGLGAVLRLHAARLWSATVTQGPGQRLRRIMQRRRAGGLRPTHHHDGQAEMARRHDLRIGRLAAAVLAHQRCRSSRPASAASRPRT